MNTSVKSLQQWAGTNSSALQGLSLRSDAEVDAPLTPVTVMFTDLEGFTRFTAQAGDEACRREMRTCLGDDYPMIRCLQAQ